LEGLKERGGAWASQPKMGEDMELKKGKRVNKATDHEFAKSNA